MIHQRDFYESLNKITASACCFSERDMRTRRLPILEAIKTIVTLYDRIMLMACAFIQAYRILTITISAYAE